VLNVLCVQLADPARTEPLEGTIEPVSKHVIRLESQFRFAGVQPESIDNLAQYVHTLIRNSSPHTNIQLPAFLLVRCGTQNA
jgi:hypothetical protein